MNDVMIKRRNYDSEMKLSGMHPILERVFLSRGIKNEEDLNIQLKNLESFHALTDIDKGVKRLAEALIEAQSIMVVGDFDADGATSTTLAVSALKAFGATDVSFLVPNRFKYGYGLTPEIVAVAAESKPKLIITVDNGISSVEGVKAANDLGIDVLITDHHLPGSELPDAIAIINPNQSNDIFPSKNLAGVGVIFYVMSALRRYLIEKNWFEEKNIPMPSMTPFLDLVALGTVADVVPLDKNNRILVREGLKRIRAKQCIPGIIALLEIAGRDFSRLQASDLGFSIAPRLNAAGRLDDMSLGIACLLANDLEKARELAITLDHLNKERKEIEANMQRQAFHALDSIEVGLNRHLPTGICLFHETWHQGVIGIVAGRVKDKFHRPTIAFARDQDGFLKGSARSISKVHIRDVLEAISTRHPELIHKFGGHAMAAGLTLKQEHLPEFSNVFSEEIRNCIDETTLQGLIESDGELSETEFSLSFAQLLLDAGPWGQHFPEPMFDGYFYVVNQRLVGGKHLKMILQTKSHLQLDAIAFNVDTHVWPNFNVRQIHAAYRLDINEYQERKSLQLMIEHFYQIKERS